MQTHTTTPQTTLDVNGNITSPTINALETRITELENKINSMHIVVTQVSESKTLPSGGQVEVNPTCPQGTVVLGGGYASESGRQDQIYLNLNQQGLNRNDIKVQEKSGSLTSSFTGIAYCASIEP